jgi:hypothetical protein
VLRRWPPPASPAWAVAGPLRGRCWAVAGSRKFPSPDRRLSWDDQPGARSVWPAARAVQRRVPRGIAPSASRTCPQDRTGQCRRTPRALLTTRQTRSPSSLDPFSHRLRDQTEEQHPCRHSALGEHLDHDQRDASQACANTDHPRHPGVRVVAGFGFGATGRPPVAVLVGLRGQ